RRPPPHGPRTSTRRDLNGQSRPASSACPSSLLPARHNTNDSIRGSRSDGYPTRVSISAAPRRFARPRTRLSERQCQRPLLEGSPAELVPPLQWWPSWRDCGAEPVLSAL